MMLVLLIMASSAQTATGLPTFQSGDRWAVLGDSITHAGWYHRYVELFYLTRFPDREVEVVNCGISGDTSSNALLRLEWDCLAARPTLVSIMFGMNDVQPKLYIESASDSGVGERKARTAAQYEQSMRKLVASLRESRVRVILITPSIYDDTADLAAGKNARGCGQALAGYAERVRIMARELDVPMVDFNGRMTVINADRQASNPAFTVVGPDRIHPTPPGHLVMAHEFLRAQGLGGLVSRIGIDVAMVKPGPLENCTLENLFWKDGVLSFTCLEKALPFPVDEKGRPALDWVPFTDEFNRQLLVITGLPEEMYELSIDDVPVRSFSASQLAAGVNLAEEANTPQMQQAREVFAALQKKWETAATLRSLASYEHAAWPDAPRPVDLGKMSEKLDARLARAVNIDAVREAHRSYLEFKPREEELMREWVAAGDAARSAAQPKPHRFTIRPAAGIEKGDVQL